MLFWVAHETRYLGAALAGMDLGPIGDFDRGGLRRALVGQRERRLVEQVYLEGTRIVADHLQNPYHRQDLRLLKRLVGKLTVAITDDEGFWDEGNPVTIACRTLRDLPNFV